MNDLEQWRFWMERSIYPCMHSGNTARGIWIFGFFGGIIYVIVTI